eukprot:1827258-Prymnesium_polylepis.1
MRASATAPVLACTHCLAHGTSERTVLITAVLGHQEYSPMLEPVQYNTDYALRLTYTHTLTYSACTLHVRGSRIGYSQAKYGTVP